MGPPSFIQGNSPPSFRKNPSRNMKKRLFGRNTSTFWSKSQFFGGKSEDAFSYHPKKNIASPNLGQISMKTGKNGFVKKKWDTSGRKRKQNTISTADSLMFQPSTGSFRTKKNANKFQGSCDLRIAVTSSLWPLVAYM